jgi:PleD family two-component response regulator
MPPAPPTEPPKKSILHLCKREVLRPLRDQILRISGFDVDSTTSSEEALSAFRARQFDLVLIDVEGDAGVEEAEHLCSEVKTRRHQQLVAFVCNWRVALHTDCPDEILRTEFDPEAFVGGIRRTLSVHE